MSFYFLVLGSLAVWRVTHLLHAEAGPGDIVAKLRSAVANSVLGRALDCFYCASVWVAAPFAACLGQTWRERLLLWPALSAAAILLEQRRPPEIGPAVYVEDAGPPAEAIDRDAGGGGGADGGSPEGGDVQLRQ